MKTNLDSLFKTSDDLESGGVWFQISDTTSFLVKRFGGKNGASVKEAHAKYMKPYARRIDNGTMSPDKENAILVKFFVNACLMNWKGVELDGRKTDFSIEAATKLFSALPELLSSLMEEANNIENYREELREEVGNS